MSRLTYEDLVEMMDRMRDRLPTPLTLEDLDRWQRASIVREPRRGVTPGGIEWRSWS